MSGDREVVLVGITGGMGSGQSTVAKLFESFGCRMINADLVARRIVERDKEVQKELGELFGDRIFYSNGQINRKLLGELAFKSEELTHKLNKIVHPRLVEEVLTQIERVRDSKVRICCLDAALIFETQMEKLFDHIIVVGSRIGLRMERIKERDGLEEAVIRDRISRQIPLEEKVKWGDYVINNNGSLEQLASRSRKVYDEIVAAMPEERPVQKSGPASRGRRGGKRHSNVQRSSGSTSSSPQRYQSRPPQNPPVPPAARPANNTSSADEEQARPGGAAPRRRRPAPREKAADKPQPKPTPDTIPKASPDPAVHKPAVDDGAGSPQTPASASPQGDRPKRSGRRPVRRGGSNRSKPAGPGEE